MNWGPGAQGGFQNALTMGMQMGQMARQSQDRREYRNALAQFDPSNPETLTPIMAANPEVGLQLRGQVERRQAQAQEERTKQLGTFRRLLEFAGDNPQQAYASAQQLGIDTSTLPQPGTPEFEPWRQQQLFIVGALEDPATADQLDRDLKRLGFEPGQPGYDEAARELILFSRGKPVTAADGRAALELPTIQMPGQGATQQAAQQQPQSVPTVPRDMFQADVQSLGLEGAIRFAVGKGLAVPITGDEEFAMLPPGAAFVGPDGLTRRKP